MLISAEIVANIQRAVGEAVFVSYQHWHPQALNEGYNALLWIGHPPNKFDELPLDHLIGQDVPASESGVVVLAIHPGGFAYVGPSGEILRIQKKEPTSEAELKILDELFAKGQGKDVQQYLSDYRAALDKIMNEYVAKVFKFLNTFEYDDDEREKKKAAVRQEMKERRDEVESRRESDFLLKNSMEMIVDRYWKLYLSTVDTPEVRAKKRAIWKKEMKERMEIEDAEVAEDELEYRQPFRYGWAVLLVIVLGIAYWFWFWTT